MNDCRNRERQYRTVNVVVVAEAGTSVRYLTYPCGAGIVEADTVVTTCSGEGLTSTLEGSRMRGSTRHGRDGHVSENKTMLQQKPPNGIV